MPDPSKSVLYPITEVFHDPYLEINLRLESTSVHKHSKTTEIVMLKFVRVAVQRTDKIGVLNHGEQ